MCKVLIFDLDGTLADDVDVHLKAWARAMEEVWRKPSEEELKKYRENVGKSLRDIMKAIYGEIDEKFFERINATKKRHFRELIGEIRPIVPREVLEKLKKHYVLALFTSTNRRTATDILNHLGIHDLFDVIVTADDVRAAKPDPTGVKIILRRTGCGEAIFVGDTIYDEETAKNAGVRFMHVKEFVRSWKLLL